MIKELVCIVCPNSCIIKVDYTRRKIKKIRGALCKKGDEYVSREIFSPTRILTSSIRVSAGELPLVSVKTDRPIPKAKIMEVMEILHQIVVMAPIKIGDILIEDVAQTGANIVATKNIQREEEVWSPIR